MNKNFKEYLINESEHYLMQKTGDILSSLQSLADEADSLGNRKVIRVAQKIIDQIREILHDRWADESNKMLKTLQKIAAHIMNAINGEGEVKDAVVSSIKVLQNGLNKKGEPINSLGSSNPPHDN